MGAVAIIFFIQLRKQSNGSGLSLAYLINLWLIHWVASAIYALPWYSNYTLNDVIAGLEQSTYAVVAFSAGYVLYTFIHGISSKQLPDEPTSLSEKKYRISDAGQTNLYIGIGLICFFLGNSSLANLPSATSLVTSAANLAVIGLMLKAWLAWLSGNRLAFWFWALSSSIFPLLTILIQGFIGFGTFSAIMVLTFIARFYRPRWKLAVMGIAAVYLGLSIYVTYMRDRNDIRETVWGGQSYGARIDQLKTTFSQFEIFDINNDKHLELIDLRLNQNALVGAAVNHIDAGRQEFANGETLIDAVIALIPRFIWPDKGVAAGSGDLVSKFTGFTFPEDTSVGVGQVMEFYINFGQWGVIIGFMSLGLIIALIDNGAGRCLATSDWPNFVCWYLPGMTLLYVGGSLVEVTAGAAASLIVAVTIKFLISSYRRSEIDKRVPVLVKSG